MPFVRLLTVAVMGFALFQVCCRRVEPGAGPAVARGQIDLHGWQATAPTRRSTPGPAPSGQRNLGQAGGHDAEHEGVAETIAGHGAAPPVEIRLVVPEGMTVAVADGATRFGEDHLGRAGVPFLLGGR